MVKIKLLKSNFSKIFNWRSASSSIFLITSLIALIVGGVKQLGHLEFLELAIFDLMMRSRSETELDSRITIVGIEESDLQTWQQSTFSDRLIANLIKKLQQHHPTTIGLDIYRDIPQSSGNQELLNQLKADNVIAIRNIGKDGVPAPPNVPANRVGFNNFLLDEDGEVRRNLMSLQIGDQALHSFGLQMSKNYLNAEQSLSVHPGYIKLRKAVFRNLKADSGGYQLSASDVRGSQILLNYRSPNKAARRLSFTQVLNGNFDADWITGKVVIIGYTAPSKKDIFYTPLNRKISGVEIHAHMVSQILSRVLDDEPLFRFIPQWSEFVWIWLWSFAGAVLVWRTKRPLDLGVGLVFACGGLSGIYFISFIGMFWIPIAPAMMGLLSTTGMILAYKTFYSSLVDELTGLANRAQIITLLQQSLAKPQNSLTAVLSINIARFKIVNDSLGNVIGDRLLIAASKRILNCIRTQDKLARVGIAEFSVILSNLEDPDCAMAIARRIQQELAQAFNINIKDREIIITTDVGIAFGEPGVEIQGEELLRNSNLAQERAKILGTNQYAVFAPRMHSETIAQWQLENDLRQGIEHQFEVYYQPIIDLKSDRIAGFEALVRWISPTRGFVSPGDFIPLAESTGLIIPLGDWILRAACRQMSQWHQQFELPTITISVNLSSHQFQADLVEQISQILVETQLAPQCLKLEITESAMMDHVETAIALLQELKALGIKLSIDDFGTGYSSLSYLQQFCADTLKVDQSFVRQLEFSQKNQAIVDIIITLAHKLDMDVIAEGIETETHQAILKALNCEYGQGYLFAKPLKSDAATALLAQETERLALNNRAQ